MPGDVPFDSQDPRRYRTRGAYRGMHSGPAGLATRLAFILIFGVIAVAAIAVISIVAAQVL